MGKVQDRITAIKRAWRVTAWGKTGNGWRELVCEHVLNSTLDRTGHRGQHNGTLIP